MNKRVLFLALSLFTLIHVCRAQASARLTLPANTVYDGTEHTLQFQVHGVTWTHADMKTFIGNLSGVNGITYFNPVVPEGETDGICHLQYKAGSKADFRALLRTLFCTLNIQRIELGTNTFENCQQIVVP